MKVLVLCGGESAERVVSWASGDAVGGWLAEAGYDVIKGDPEQPGQVWRVDETMAPHEIGLAAPPPRHYGQYDARTVEGLLKLFEQQKPDLVFPILHGGRGEDGTLQALLEWVKVPFTGSRALACGLAMNKYLACILFRTAGVPTPINFVVTQKKLGDVAIIEKQINSEMGFPVVVKPLYGGSTVGLTKVHNAAELSDALKAVQEQYDDALIEDLFEGRELTCTVVDGEAYPLVEIKPKVGFYDYSNKYTAGRTEYLCPAPVKAETTERIQSDAAKAFHALGCRGFARIDFLLNEQEEFVCLEVNTLPGMTKHSLVPMAARAHGENLPQLMKKLVVCALRDGLA
jgi:D-alanine-D-alanine ligase